ncbi:hypothetical protein TWF703_002642 [Orbilia oligospora]|uniref:FAD-binding PCMH-type domain-containing protein n=1 Tax=Orbilia oligospora TaxID=2813651 RepID=A0A7C8JJK6_ORBOL|nr:hypothetical protein TWF703_002642 [Orbilia oligospora]
MKTVLAHGLVASRSILSNGLDLAGVTEFSRAQVCCLALKGISDKAVSFSGSSTYTNETHNYFSAANIVQPACVFSPETAEHVAYAIRIFNSANCSFSVRSGGHLPIPGSNGQNGAILLATTKLKTVDVRGKTARIGPGNTWTEVYRETDKVGKVVLGGRIGTVGVGGLVLGGGISFQGSEHGFACDTVVNYQVVTADGQVQNANASSNPDLFWALKGGTNRFGIVTAFDMRMYPLSKATGGTITYQYSSLPLVLEQIDVVHRHLESDPKASFFVNVMDAADVGVGKFVEVVLYYGKPSTGFPIAFRSFFDIPGIVANTVSTKPYSELVPNGREGLSPGTLSHTWRSLTYKRSSVVNKKVARIFQEEAEKFRLSQDSSLQPGVFTLAYEPYATSMLSASQRTGGNALSLDRQDGPLMLALLTYSWINQTESATRTAAVKASVERMKRFAQAEEKHIDFIYINAAAPDQDPFRGYGQVNYQRLRDIRRKYDPKGVFSVLQAGGFHL